MPKSVKSNTCSDQREAQEEARATRNSRAKAFTCWEAAPSVWEKIAERQLKERLRGEQTQKELRAACATQAKLALELKKKLKLCMREKRLSSLTRPNHLRIWDLITDDSAGIYAEQLTQVAKTYLEIQHQCSQPNNSLQLATNLTQGAELMKRNSNGTGVVFEMKSATTLPFDVHEAGSA
ncbi:unnamed protein product [Phytophthora lilii]|uniref:Unnamed protein product n=1 Tax=Phytophthora lilii TaxID=2077276 RepID=A0A9W6U930_9STRA|nr:unnamed protein product [Phytophthora lilii]